MNDQHLLKSAHLLSILLLICFSPLLWADQLVIKFEQPTSQSPVNCGDSWVESEINMTINTFPDVANCVFYLQDSQFMAAPAQLSLNLSALGEIHQVEIDVNDFCAIACTTAVLSGNSEIVSEVTNQSYSMETLTLSNPDNFAIDQLQLQSKEAFFYEIRIEFTPF